MSDLVDMRPTGEHGTPDGAGRRDGLRRARKPGHGQSGGRIGNSYATATRDRDEWVEAGHRAGATEFVNGAFRDLRLRQWDDGSWQMLERGRIVSEFRA